MQQGPRTIRELLSATQPWLEKRGIDTPRLDAEVLLAAALGETRLKLYMDLDRPLSDAEVDAYRALVKRRGAREPVAYILGEKEFYGLAFKVGPDVLIPRPDTETLVEECLRLLPKDATGRIVDACTGTGCIAVAILTERPGLRAIATDASEAAAAIARENAARLGVAERLEVRTGDLLAPVQDERDLLLVVANPPYIRRAEGPGLMPEVRDHEPSLALFGEDEDGLGHHRRILADAPALLARGGAAVLEIGYEQGEAALALPHEGLSDGRLVRDLARHPRAVVFEKT